MFRQRRSLMFSRHRRRNNKSKVILLGVLFMVTVIRFILSSADSNDAETAFKQIDSTEITQQVGK